MLTIFTFLNVVLYFSNAHLYFYDARMTSIKPLYCYFITIGAGLALLVFRQGVRLSSASRKMIVWSLAFLALVGVSFATISTGGKTELDVMIKLCEAMALLVIFILCFQDEGAARGALYAVLIVVIGSVLINYAEYTHLFSSKVTMSTVGGRAAGLYENPNISGQQLVLGMVLSTFIVPKKLRWWYCIFVATGVMLTFSRGAIILWMIAVLGLAWTQTFALPRRLSIAGIVLLIVLLGVTLVSGAWVGAFKSVGLGGYLDSNTQSRIGTSFLDQKDYSAVSRMQVAQRGMALFFDRPLLGWGVGATQDLYSGVATHNMYLMLGAEYGIFGLAMFFWLLGILWYGNIGQSRIIAVLYAVGGLFTHNNFDMPTVIVAIALSVAAIGLSNAGKKTPACSDEHPSSWLEQGLAGSVPENTQVSTQ